VSEITGESPGFHPLERGIVDEALLDAGPLDDDDAGADARPREGLPPSFRMRHDAHYVDHVIERSSPHAVRMIAVGDIDRHGCTGAPGADVQSLARSMREVGVLQPLLVRPASGRFQLIAGMRRLQAAAVAGLHHVPCIVHEADDATVDVIRGNANLRADAAAPAPARNRDVSFGAGIATELAESLEAAAICLSLHSGDAQRTFTARVAKELLGVEIQRAGRAARAASVVAERPTPILAEVSLGPLLQDVVAASEVARRMVGLAADVSLVDQESRMRGDRRLLTLAVACAADAMIIRASGPGALGLSVKSSNVSPTLSIEITLAPSPGPVAASRFFDARDHDHPWGPSAAVLLNAAARIAEVHGGRAEVRSHGDLVVGLMLLRK
jgi:hypothetical protein